MISFFKNRNDYKRKWKNEEKKRGEKIKYKFLYNDDDDDDDDVGFRKIEEEMKWRKFLFFLPPYICEMRFSIFLY